MINFRNGSNNWDMTIEKFLDSFSLSMFGSTRKPGLGGRRCHIPQGGTHKEVLTCPDPGFRGTPVQIQALPLLRSMALENLAQLYNLNVSDVCMVGSWSPMLHLSCFLGDSTL